LLYTVSVWAALLCYEHDEEQEQVAASSTGGGLVGMLVNLPTLDKGPHEASPRTGVHWYFYV
jgi:hypothetical protein